MIIITFFSSASTKSGRSRKDSGRQNCDEYIDEARFVRNALVESTTVFMRACGRQNRRIKGRRIGEKEMCYMYYG